MAQSPQTCFPTIQPYKTALAEATASSASTGRGHICVQAVYDTMTAYYNACSNKAQSQYGFDLSVPDPEYGGPTTFYYYCLAKHKVQLDEKAATATGGVAVKPTVALINQSYCSAGNTAYTNAVSFAKGGNDCTQQVMDGLNWYQQACGEQFLVSSLYYSDPASLRMYCLTKYNVALDGKFRFPSEAEFKAMNENLIPTSVGGGGSVGSGSSDANSSSSSSSSSNTNGNQLTYWLLGAGLLVVLAVCCVWSCFMRVQTWRYILGYTELPTVARPEGKRVVVAPAPYEERELMRHEYGPVPLNQQAGNTSTYGSFPPKGSSG